MKSLEDPVFREGRWFDSTPDYFAWVMAGRPPLHASSVDGGGG